MCGCSPNPIHKEPWDLSIRIKGTFRVEALIDEDNEVGDAFSVLPAVRGDAVQDAFSPDRGDKTANVLPLYITWARNVKTSGLMAIASVTVVASYSFPVTALACSPALSQPTRRRYGAIEERSHRC